MYWRCAIALVFTLAAGSMAEEPELPMGVQPFAIGVTTDGETISAWITEEESSPHGERFRILLVGNDDAEATAIRAAMRWFGESDAAKSYRERFAISAVPSSGVSDDATFPPAGDAYAGAGRPAHTLWRWIGMHAPDVVLELSNGSNAAVTVPAEAAANLRRFADATGPKDRTDLPAALLRSPAANTGTIPTATVRYDAEGRFLRTLLDRIERAELPSPSAGRGELQRRANRSPLVVAKTLAKHYGHGLDGVSYIPSVALIGRLRLGDLTGDRSHEADVRRIVEPYRSGEKRSFGTRANGGNVAGHLVFAELFERTDDEAYEQLVVKVLEAACDPEAEGTPFRPHSEMSDAVFMGGPLLARAAAITGDAKYLDLCRRHVRFMTKLNVRDDGLHRHSPLDETPWGRGNGFPALGLAMVLDALPAEHPDRADYERIHLAHLNALAPRQDVTGMWHQVVDHPGSYREMSCTCMITYSLLRGLRTGRLDREDWEPVVRRAWAAINVRIDDNGGLVDVCTGTGKQKSLQAYLDRKAILGRDPRGGAMAFLVATEMAAWERDGENRE